MSALPTAEPGLRYIPYAPTSPSVEAGWLADGLGVPVAVAGSAPTLNLAAHRELPSPRRLRQSTAALGGAGQVVVEGVGGFLWAALLRAGGFRGSLAIVPYINPSTWYDVSCVAVYRRFARADDRILVGSTPSARLLRSLGVDPVVAEPYGVDCDVFHPRPDARRTREHFGIVAGPMLVFAGRGEADKDLHRLLRIALRARLLFPELQVVLALRTVDPAYVAVVERELSADYGVRLVRDASRAQLAGLYSGADVFVTAATSHFETFGRAPAEALACGTPAIAPRYDGFPEVLAQPGGTLVELEWRDGAPAVDETLLLRAVYEVLSGPPRHARAEIAAAARRRLARSRTLAGAFARRPDAGGEAAELRVPQEWADALARLAGATPSDALASLWAGRERHDRLSAHDDDFRAAVRAALAREPCR